MFSFRRLVTSAACAALCLMGATTDAYNIGIGKSDITGPAAEVVMMGYADSNQKAAGLLNRLYARAFIVEDDNKQRVVFVNCDLQAVFQMVHQEVIKQLKAKYNGLYTEQNVVLHATHTHAGPGGSSAYFLYDVSIYGFITETYQSIVDGIVKAIVAAHDSVAPGTISFNKGQVLNGGKNRSPLAYLGNSEAERALYSTDRDVDLRLLQFRNPDKTLRGVLGWYPVHPTSLTQNNKLISGDNKGYAEFVLEDKYPGLIAAIGISNAADVSPNLVDNGNGTFRGEGKTDIESAEIMGARQANKILELISSEAEEIKGSVAGRLSYINFSNVTIKGAVATPENPYAFRTCPAIVGQNFAAGTEDGRALGQFTEGDLKANVLFKALGSIIKSTPDWVKQCQTSNKVPLLAVGLIDPVPWAPEILPVQVIKIGQFGIGVTNFETSTMSGRRIRKSLGAALAPAGVTEVEVSSISNAYAQYLTTPEEFARQHYEGASTLFGPNQLAAVQQELNRVAASIVDPKIPLDVGPTPRQFVPSSLLNFQTGVVMDTTPIGKKFGSVRTQPAAAYKIGDTASVDFYGAHPKNRLSEVKSFCDVERQNADGSFTTIMTDSHWDVRFKWARDSVADSKSVCEWYIRPGGRTTAAGTYRFRHRGFSKPFIGAITAYEGVSATFTVA